MAQDKNYLKLKFARTGAEPTAEDFANLIDAIPDDVNVDEVAGAAANRLKSDVDFIAAVSPRTTNDLNAPSEDTILTTLGTNNVLAQLKDDYNQKIGLVSSQASTAIIGEASLSMSPVDTTNKFRKYSVKVAGTYINFLDNNNSPIVVIADDPENDIVGDLSKGVVELWGENNIWSKVITPLPVANLATKAELKNYVPGPIALSVGKNLYNPATMNNPGVISILSGAIVEGSANDIYSRCPLPNGPIGVMSNYVIQGWTSSDVQKTIRFEDINNNMIGFVNAASSVSLIRVAVPVGTMYICFPINRETSGIITTSSVQLEVGDSATSYEPFKSSILKINNTPTTATFLNSFQNGPFQKFAVVSDQLGVYLSLKDNNSDPLISASWLNIRPRLGLEAGKNKFNYKNVQLKKRISSAGHIISDLTYTNNDIISSPIPVLAGNPYIISGYTINDIFARVVVYLDANLVELGASISAGTTALFFSVIPPVGTEYIVVPVSWQNAPSDGSMIQVENGSTVTSYEEYKSLVKTIDGSGIASTIVNPYLQRFNFNIPPSIEFANKIWQIQNQYFTDFNWTQLKNDIEGQMYYVDPVNGNDTNVGTIDLPLKSVKAALQKPDIKILMLNPGIYYYDQGWQGYNTINDLKVMVNGMGKAILTTAISVEWVRHPSLANVWQASYSDINTITSVVDMQNNDADGVAIRLITRSGIDKVNTTPNSFYHDPSSKIIYVQLNDGRAPDEYIISLLNAANVYSSNMSNIYMEDVDVWGGIAAVFKNSNSNQYKKVVLNNCKFNYTWKTGGQGGKDGIYCEGYINVSSHNCGAHYNQGDGFNYYGYVQYFEMNCLGRNNGNSSNNANNGSTSHVNCLGVRLNGDYQYNYGKNIQDIENCKSYNISCKAGNSMASSATDRAAFAFGSEISTSDMNGEGWLINCIGVGPDYILKTFASVQAHLYSGNILQGPNIIDPTSIIDNMQPVQDVNI